MTNIWVRVGVAFIGLIFIAMGLDVAIHASTTSGIWGTRWSSVAGALGVGIGVADIVAAIRGKMWL